MKYDDVFDGSSDEEKRRMDVARKIVQDYQKLAAPPDKAKIAAKRAKYDEFNAERQAIEAEIAPIAQRLGGDQFEQFRQEVLTKFPEAEKYINLQWAFGFHNPEKRKEADNAWAAYGKERAAGKTRWEND